MPTVPVTRWLRVVIVNEAQEVFVVGAAVVIKVPSRQQRTLQSSHVATMYERCVSNKHVCATELQNLYLLVLLETMLLAHTYTLLILAPMHPLQ